jgi:glyoxylate reductase
LQSVRGADAVLSLLTERIDADFLDAAGPQLKVVANLAVGFDNFVVPEMTRRGVIGTNTPDVLTDTTADLAFTLLMATARMLPQAQKYVFDDKWRTWEPLGFLGQDVHHATLGLVGLGRIGAAMARRGAGFEMKVIYYDAYRRQDLEQQYGYEFRDSVEAVLREADFVSLHTPLMEETHHLMNAERLKLMKPTAILINSSRGPVVDPKALYDALKDGTIWAAGLDVTEPEPLPVNDPLLTLDNCLVVPHIASASIKTRDAMSELAADNIVAVLGGKAPKTAVNREVVEQKGLR